MYVGCMTELLTKQDLLWLSFHKQLARLGNSDIVEFSKFVLDFDWDPKPKLTSNDLQKMQPRTQHYYLKAQKFAERYTIPAIQDDYAAWLKGFKRKGGVVTHRPGKFNNYNWVVLQEKVIVPPFYGASSLNVIVPKHLGNSVKEICYNRGHNNFFFVKNFEHVGSQIPEYKGM